jgi:putative membrane protein
VLITGLVLAGLAALIHIYIFVLESLRWERPATRAAFGVTAETAAATRPLAFNQGFYNLFLAIEVVLGLALLGTQRRAGIGLVAFAAGSMLAAALVLVLSDRTKLRAAAVQGGFPLLAEIALLVHAL